MRLFFKFILLNYLLTIVLANSVYAQCDNIQTKGSNQNPSGRCAPVQLDFSFNYNFWSAVSPDSVQIYIDWGDGSDTAITPNHDGSNISFFDTITHTYPPTGIECTYTALSYVNYNGEICLSSEQQQQFRSWNIDNQNGGQIEITPNPAEICLGDTIVQQFSDASTFNCNEGQEPDYPNEDYRWVQFVYNTVVNGGDRIPNIYVDSSGVLTQLTDASGNSLGIYYGPIVRMNKPVEAPNQMSYNIVAPPGGKAGDIFEVTMRNWNICNAYDDTPLDGFPPADIANGDNAPIVTTAYIEIVTTPLTVSQTYYTHCTGDNITLSASGPGGSTIRWYSDSLQTNLLHTGTPWNPAQAPDSVISNNIGATHTFWVTATDNGCESLPQKVTVEIIESPTPANAGIDSFICADAINLYANQPVIGTGAWIYGGTGAVVNTAAYNSAFNTIPEGANSLTWQITNGPCVSSDDVVITRDLQPSAANAGNDSSFCNANSLTLYATAADNNGGGSWSVFSGSATITSPNSNNSSISNIAADSTVLVWTVNSANGACAATTDTLILLRDISPNNADAGSDKSLCDSSETILGANAATNQGTGQWNLVSGTGIFQNNNDPATNVSSISYGTNIYEWQITSKHNICPISADSVTISRYQNVTSANAGNDTSYCEEYASALNGNNPSVGTGTWAVLTNPSGVAPTFTPSANAYNATMNILPGNEGLYSIAWQITNGTCISSDFVFINFGVNPPPANAGQPDTVCGVSGQLNATAFTQGTTTWSLVNGPGTASLSPNVNDPTATVNILAGNEGLYEFEWTLSSGSCNPTKDTTTILFNPLPQTPVIAADSSCGSSTFTLTAANGPLANTNKWYDSSSGGSLLFTGTSFTTPVITSNTTYWASGYNDTTGCESSRTSVQAIVNPIPGKPNGFVNPHCGPGNILLQANIASNATTNKWYDSPVTTTELSISQNYTTNVTVTSLFYVSSFNTTTGCEGLRDTIEALIHPVPEALTLKDTSNCGQSAFVLETSVTTNSTTARWYNDTDTLNYFLQDTVYNTPLLDSNTVYWLSSYNDTTGCESPLTPLNVEIFSIPDMPATTDIINCGPGNFTLKPVKGNNTTHLRWYYFPTGGELVLQSDSFETPFLINNKTYYVSGYDSTYLCESGRSGLDVEITQVPSPQSIIGKSSVVVNETGIIYSVDNHTGSVYDWVIPAGINLVEDNGSWIRLGFPNIDVYNITVQETRGGCIGPVNNKQITVTDGQLQINLVTHNLESCSGAELLLSPAVIGGVSPYTINWSGDNAYLSSSSDLQPTFNAPNSGNYTLYLAVTDYNYNTAFDTIYIETFESPTAEIIVPDTFVCFGNDQPIIVNYNSQTASNSHVWTGQTAALSASNISDPVFIPFDVGTYNLFYQIIDNNSCKAYDSISMYVESPVARFSTDEIAGCSPLEIQFTNTSPTTEGSLSWDMIDTVIQGVENPTYTFNNTTPYLKYYNVALTLTTENGCSDDYISAITVYPNPVATISANVDESCSPANIIFTSNQGGVIYDWDFGDGEQIQTGFTTAHTYDEEILSDKTYTVKLTTSSTFGCIDSSASEILIHPSPDANFTVTPEEQMFPDTLVTITNLTQGSWDYKWYFGDGTESIIKDPGTHAYQSPNHYNVSLVVKSAFCKDSLPKQIRIVPHPPIAKFAPIDPGCMPHTVTFKNLSTHAKSYFWEFGDGNVSNKAAPVHTFYEPGIYKVKLTASGDGGENNYSDTSRVYILPNSYFDLAPRIVFVNDEAVHCFNLSENADMYEWDFGDGTTSTELSPKHVYGEEGTFNVTLKVWTENNCYDVYEMTNAVEVQPAGTVGYPTGFRPLSPIPENRIFKPAIIDNVDDYHLMIFNRWGDLVFESFDRDEGWDGYYNGKPAKQDVYVWKVTGVYNSGESFIKAGDVTLLH